MKNFIKFLIFIIYFFSFLNANEKNNLATQKNIKNSILQKILTTEEKEYLKTIKTIKMCNNPNWKPIEFLKKDNSNKAYGIAIDTLHILEKKLNIQFQHIQTKNWTQSQQFLKDKKCDILPAAIKTKKREKYAIFTKPYLIYKLAIITKDDKPFVSNLDSIKDKSISRKKNTGLIHKLKRKYPNINIIETKNYLDSIQKVSTGEAYYTIATLPVISYYINQFALSNIHIAGYTNMTYNLSIAVRNDKPILMSILDKTLKTISQKEHKNISSKWSNIKIKEEFNYSYLQNALIVIFIIGFLMVFKQYILKKQNKNLKIMVDEQTKELKEINENLEQKIIIEVEKSNKREKQIFESRKMAQMGEMIGNIAHQWRQPLSVISTATSGMEIEKEHNLLTDKKFTNYCNIILKNTEHLSQTIETFRNFIKEKKENKKIIIQERIDVALQICKASLQSNQINLINEINYKNPIEHTIIIGELSQVIINIINNAKDILKEKKIKNPWIKINLKQNNETLQKTKQNKVIITIEDNGGGIPDANLKKIFEPYFTTKHQSQGTGLGLHMSYKIITESLNGKFFVKNTLNGAKFFIEFPVKKGRRKK